ncbi:MAG TPA: glycoside hydrolase family 3 C-terminal domain-containing protein [Bacteroidales bacterium]|nr:glycoside hydrolase family 3 C-terminal domain-containing protein [Bacteroidales bacterium]
MASKKFTTLLIVSILALNSCNKDKTPRYLNPNQSTEKRVDDLVSRMTLEEKVSQLTNHSRAVERLGISEYNWWNECLHGVARAGKATVFPQAIGLAATWDRDMIFEMATVTATEARAKYNDFQAKGKRGIYQGLTFWSPNINIFRDPRWGRGMESYGECPYLTGEIGTQFIKGLQGDHEKYFKVIATSKHYAVHSGPESSRHSFNAEVSERDFRDTYFPAFRKTIEDGKAYSVMCAYNAYFGAPCCGSNDLLKQLLRDELNFEGYVVSDCGAIRDFWDGHNIVGTPPEASAMAVLAGTDLNCGRTYDSLASAVNMGLLTEKDVDVPLKRLLTARMKLGMFDPPEMDPWAELNANDVSTARNNRIALETARKSMVLLKNDNNTLPLSKDLNKVAVIGPNAIDVEVLYANYNGFAIDPVTPLRGIREKLESKATVKYARGCAHAEGLPYFEIIPNTALFTDKKLTTNGLNAAYFNNTEAEGEPVISKVDNNIDFYWWDNAPMESLEDDNFSVRWTGYLVPEKTGYYAIGGESKYFKLFLEGEQIASRSSRHRPSKVYKRGIKLQAGKAYQIEIVTWDQQGDANCHFIWSPPDGNIEQEAIQTARWADQVIMFMGLSPRLEGEQMKVEVDGFHGGDRTNITLPNLQQEFIKKIYATGTPVVLVLLNGSAIAINWEDEHIPAIMEAWYPGESAGTAIADVLFGDYNPAGRLPVTFYKSVNDLPDFENYQMEGRTYRYFRGDVLYPFGHGLSFSNFSYSNIEVNNSEIANGDSVTVSVDVTNTSDIDGEEVVQFYIHEKNAPDQRPNIDLRGFDRVKIKAGETKKVSVVLTEKDLAYYNTNLKEYTMNKGIIEVFAGPSSDRNQLIKTQIRVN